MKLTKEQQRLLSQVYEHTTSDADNIRESVYRLISIGKSLRNSYEVGCSQRQTEKQAERREKRETRLEKEAKQIGNSLGFIVYIQTDCRGCSVYLLPNSKLKIAQEAIEEGRYPDVFSWVDSNYSGHSVAWF